MSLQKKRNLKRRVRRLKNNYATYEIEDSLVDKGYMYIVGVDEVGRGPGAGPVVAGAVYIPPDALPVLLMIVKDSKKLSENKRDKIAQLIKSTCKYSIGIIDNDIIDRVNVLNATKMAMRIAINSIENIDYVIVDGTVYLDQLEFPQTQIIGGDAKSLSIAAASIIAKVERDEMMRTMHWIYPQYNWIKNKGYLTKEHCAAIKTYGITDYHRASFRKVGYDT